MSDRPSEREEVFTIVEGDTAITIRRTVYTKKIDLEQELVGDLPHDDPMGQYGTVVAKLAEHTDTFGHTPGEKSTANYEITITNKQNKQTLIVAHEQMEALVSMYSAMKVRENQIFHNPF